MGFFRHENRRKKIAVLLSKKHSRSTVKKINMMHNIKTYIFSLFVTALALALGACSKSTSDAPDQDNPDNAPVRRASVTVRAGRDPNATDNELINSWWAVFVSSTNGKVYAKHGNSLSPAVEQDIVTFEIPQGTYRVYAFANITEEQLKAATGISFEMKKAAPAAETISSAVWDNAAISLNRWASEALIPMTGYKDVKVTNEENQSFSIEVVRMLAKMELTFNNLSKQEITVNSLIFSPYSHGNINLLPDYRSLEHAPVYTQLDKVDETLFSTPGFRLAGNEGTTTASDSRWFYLRECVVPEKTSVEGTEATGNDGLFKFTVNMRKGAHDARDVVFYVDGFSYINRNDYIRIPVNFTDITDFDVKITPKFYPPIGGYPALWTEESYTQPVTTITFRTHGQFELSPELLLADDTKLVGPEYVRIESFTVTAPGPEGFMTLEWRDREVVGQIFDITGSAEVEFKIGARAVNSGTYQEFTRKVIIKREQ